MKLCRRNKLEFWMTFLSIKTCYRNSMTSAMAMFDYDWKQSDDKNSDKDIVPDSFHLLCYEIFLPYAVIMNMTDIGKQNRLEL